MDTARPSKRIYNSTLTEEDYRKVMIQTWYGIWHGDYIPIQGQMKNQIQVRNSGWRTGVDSAIAAVANSK
jgi:hypothetical protein